MHMQLCLRLVVLTAQPCVAYLASHIIPPASQRQSTVALQLHCIISTWHAKLLTSQLDTEALYMFFMDERRAKSVSTLLLGQHKPITQVLTGCLGICSAASHILAATP